MNDSTVDSLIPYDEIVQEALRAVVGRVLGEVKAQGLPGEHHFYITFKTQMAGVTIPNHLTERFPDEMTIVLQHKYWDRDVQDDHFSVGLSFNQIPSTLIIPFAAITTFVDPAVDFALHFQVDDTALATPTPDNPQNDGDSDGTDGNGDGAKSDGSNVVSVDFGKKS